MVQYIDKSALVAEIEKLISNGKFKCQQSQENNDQESYIAWSEHIATCGKILILLDTLEVKEVDLDKPFEGIKVQTSMESGSLDEVIVTTKYKAQKGEKV